MLSSAMQQHTRAAPLVWGDSMPSSLRQRPTVRAHQRRSHAHILPRTPYSSNESSLVAVASTTQVRRRKHLLVTASVETTPPAIAKKPLPQVIRSEFFSDIQKGTPKPLGASVCADKSGINFAVHTPGVAVSLCLWTLPDFDKGVLTHEIPLDPAKNRTGTVWHIKLANLAECFVYGYRVDGGETVPVTQRFDKTKILLDPYAKAVVGRKQYMDMGTSDTTWPQLAGAVPKYEDDFDWKGDKPLGLKMKDLVVYEMHVRGFTADPSSAVSSPGTYKGVIEKLPYLKSLGVNCIELLPIHEFNEMEYYTKNPATGEYRTNFWGYSTINFFSPMARYASESFDDCGREAVREFKEMVRECHRYGIEVILDVVFNHTAEGNEKGPCVSFRGLDNHSYYMLAPQGEYYNYSGCGNVFNCNHPIARQLIVDSLRYWVEEMHVDGFRFDLAAIMTRASSEWKFESVFDREPQPGDDDSVVTGTPLDCPPVIDMISSDPVLKGTKLVAEAWDAGGLYLVGSFPHFGRWAEWNGKFRDEVRQFIKGTDGFVSQISKRICGSPDLYQQGNRKPAHSTNFITCHDGFTMQDLVTYNEKHNIDNGEDNRDGENHNLSWNCGEEGPGAGFPVQRLRQRQIRNMMVMLLTSQGVPMIHMGDEYGHTKNGNNNTYCHDNRLNYFLWDELQNEDTGLHRFVSKMIQLRMEFPQLRLGEFPTGACLEWHGVEAYEPDWSDNSRFIAYTIHDKSGEGNLLYIAYNTSHAPQKISLPAIPGHKWFPKIDTGKAQPYDVLEKDELTAAEWEAAFAQLEPMLAYDSYFMLPYSSLVMVSQPEKETVESPAP